MYLSLLLAAAQAEVPEAPTPDLLAPNTGLVVWTAVTFGIVLFILWRYAWGPISKALEEREENISNSIERAEKALAEAKQVQADNQKARREAEREAQRILREAREAAESLREDEVEETRERIRKMQEQAQAEIEREKQGALEELREEVADLAIQAASKILKEDVDGDRQRRLVDDFIDDLPTN